MIRVAVVGAGVSGLTAAAVLRRAAIRTGQEVHITVLEKSERIGGQIHSTLFSSNPIDVGAEGFSGSPDSSVARLIRDLELPLVHFPCVLDDSVLRNLSGTAVDQSSVSNGVMPGKRSFVHQSAEERTSMLGFQVPLSRVGKGLRYFVDGMSVLTDALVNDLKGGRNSQIPSSTEFAMSTSVQSVSTTADGAVRVVCRSGDSQQSSYRDFDRLILASGTAAEMSTILDLPQEADNSGSCERNDHLSVHLLTNCCVVDHSFTIAPELQKDLGGLRAVAYLNRKFPERFKNETSDSCHPSYHLYRFYFRPGIAQWSSQLESEYISHCLNAVGIEPISQSSNGSHRWHFSYWSNAIPVFTPEYMAACESLKRRVLAQYGGKVTVCGASVSGAGVDQAVESGIRVAESAISDFRLHTRFYPPNIDVMYKFILVRNIFVEFMVRLARKSAMPQDTSFTNLSGRLIEQHIGAGVVSPLLGAESSRRGGHSAVSLLGGTCVLVFGGQSSYRSGTEKNSSVPPGKSIAGECEFVFSGESWVFHVDSRVWSLVVNIRSTQGAPSPRAFHVCVAIDDTTVFLHGGVMSDGTASDDSWLGRLKTNTSLGPFAIEWEKIPLSKGDPNPSPRLGHAAQLYSGKSGSDPLVVISGGQSGNGMKSFGDIWSFSVKSKRWSQLTAGDSIRGSNRAFHGMALVDHDEFDFIKNPRESQTVSAQDASLCTSSDSSKHDFGVVLFGGVSFPEQLVGHLREESVDENLRQNFGDILLAECIKPVRVFDAQRREWSSLECSAHENGKQLFSRGISHMTGTRVIQLKSQGTPRSLIVCFGGRYCSTSDKEDPLDTPSITYFDFASGNWGMLNIGGKDAKGKDFNVYSGACVQVKPTLQNGNTSEQSFVLFGGFPVNAETCCLDPVTLLSVSLKDTLDLGE